MDFLKPTIVLVDDEEEALDAVSLVLEETFRVLPARGADEALQLLREETVAAVVTDHRMPGMSGVDLLVEVKNRYPDVARVLLTAYADCDVLTKACNEAHIHRYIAKPGEPGKMADVLADVVEKHGPILCARKLTRGKPITDVPPPSAAPVKYLDYEEDALTSEIAYPPVQEDTTVDEFVRAAGNGHWRWIVLGSIGFVASMALTGWAVYELAEHFLS